MRLTVDGQRTEISTKRECEPAKWNSSAGRKNDTREDVKILDAYLDTIQSKVYEVHRQLIEAGRHITAESVKNILVGSAVRPKMILEIFPGAQ
ncbi:Arm DNA-binding domain-containing protein [Dyadobacter sp. CY327]|uniref:Arm DNA-binding domain-containing protein n=1 Tax=Dyadobacter sp. CY327 TaxID=2907301 RepID=UPI001F3F399A|nr:Arm DNA-binding domain-containing protein [Dyadobacter sp. CY327]MCE7070880.1 Arm DNA-binding domain-containing protein [Dyadobacter sp. CY327]